MFTITCETMLTVSFPLLFHPWPPEANHINCVVWSWDTVTIPSEAGMLGIIRCTICMLWKQMSQRSQQRDLLDQQFLKGRRMREVAKANGASTLGVC